MRSGRRSVALCSLLLVVSVSTTTFAKGWLRDVDHALSVAQTQRRPMVLFVSADGCVHCTRMIETTFRDTAVRKTLGTWFVAAAIKDSERPDLMQQLQIRSYPTTLVVSPSGQVLDQMVGYVSAEQLQTRLAEVTNRQQNLIGAQSPSNREAVRYAAAAAPPKR